jgi:hypothetical protein
VWWWAGKGASRPGQGGNESPAAGVADAASRSVGGQSGPDIKIFPVGGGVGLGSRLAHRTDHVDGFASLHAQSTVLSLDLTLGYLFLGWFWLAGKIMR